MIPSSPIGRGSRLFTGAGGGSNPSSGAKRILAAALALALAGCTTAQPVDRCFEARRGLIALMIIIGDKGPDWAARLEKAEALVDLYCPPPVPVGEPPEEALEQVQP